MESILSIRGLSVSFATDGGMLCALRGMDLDIGRGEVLALVGESGSGKSVTSRAILGILPRGAVVESGEIIYGKRDLLKLGEGEMSRLRGREISMVPQDPFLSLDPITRVGYQIAESVREESGENTSVHRRARAVELMREVGIIDPEKRFYEYPFRLSGGMRQRIAIAAALAPSPKLLICDEPTTALDVTIEAQILDLLERLRRERGLSMLFITHDLGVVARIADRVAVMYAGKIVEEGRVEEIFYDPRHPYTWSLLSSMPSGDGGRLRPIPGCVPDMRNPPVGDAFAPRSEWAMKIDYMMEPPVYDITETHRVASWLYHKNAPRQRMPGELSERIRRQLSVGDREGRDGGKNE